MVEPPVPLTALSEDQRAQAHTRFTIIRPALEGGVTQAQVARTHDISKSTIQRWVKRYRENGLAGLADAQVRSDKGTSRRLPAEAVTLIEGLALQTPPRTIAAIHRQVCTIAEARGWNVPSYDSVYRIIKKLDPALLLIVDEANRLKDAGLELIRDFADRGEFGLVFLGMPGLEKRLMRAPQLYSRIGFAHEMEPLSDEARDFLEKRWSHRVKAYSDNFTDKEAVAALLRVARGNIRLIERLMMQVEHVLVANQLQIVTKEVVETARQNLIIGPN